MWVNIGLKKLHISREFASTKISLKKKLDKIYYSIFPFWNITGVVGGIMSTHSWNKVMLSNKPLDQSNQIPEIYRQRIVELNQ